MLEVCRRVFCIRVFAASTLSDIDSLRCFMFLLLSDAWLPIGGDVRVHRRLFGMSKVNRYLFIVIQCHYSVN